MFIADEISRERVEDLLPYVGNSRKHSDDQVARLVAWIKEVGFTAPIMVRDKTILAGHGRLLAARKLGIDQVPVVRLDHLTEAQARAYVIQDNRLAEMAEWDEDMLKVELAALQDHGYDLGALAFEQSEIDALLAPAGTKGRTDPDAVPPTPAVPVTRLGDVWLLDRHRLACGDSTSAEDVGRLLAGVKPHLMVTDPPYGVEYDPTRTSDNPKKAGKVLNDDRADWREAWALFPGDVAYVWCSSMYTHVVLESLVASGFDIRAEIIWSKDRFTLGRGHYHWQHEPCWYAVRKGRAGHWGGDRKQSTLWSIKAREDGGHGHGTQKPVECMRRPIENNSSPGQVVYEPFSGSGTTIIAAEQTGRSCYAMELNPPYVDVDVKRWQEFTGLVATLEGDGRSFAEIAAEREAARG